ncbi:MAG: carbon storage regulator [Tissierellia bacterium]|nr:carbon storage regulator [Tissierellia bacterium]MDD4779335.1 carbon storage regulator [Tissierellia bacterium]
MLVIKRKTSESILIGEDIEIIITEISQDKVNIAINAPRDIKIIRKELADTCEFNITASKKINKSVLTSIKSKLKKSEK